MTPQAAVAYAKLLTRMNDLTLLICADDAGLYDLVRCPQGICFYWRTTVLPQLAIPLEKELKSRDHLHDMFHFVRDYREYAPCPV